MNMNVMMGVGLFVGLIMWLIGIAVIGAVAYFVIKKAVKAALREWSEERGR
ncbi:MAG TPA: hypothetical protein IAA04_00795 [Candidatus Lachnoclostridium pullistercoris]|uniref:Uncharacterized protein n=1 Tax=Candidatus Lachnoclostridium pullistercoris TaxID=2838632 RepID=A0A9D2T688_9FIRM|nr:hypothetical protein [Candidatus Lachnoclostridium pullistercoris]